MTERNSPFCQGAANPGGSGTTIFHHGSGNGTTTGPFVDTTHVLTSGKSQSNFADDAEDRTETFFRFSLDVNPNEMVSSQLMRYNLDLAIVQPGVGINVPLITCVDAVEGVNTLATGSKPATTS